MVEPDWSAIRYLNMDEFALHKDIATPRWSSTRWGGKCAGSARAARETARAFFEQLPPDAAQRIDAVLNIHPTYTSNIGAATPRSRSRRGSRDHSRRTEIFRTGRHG